jgi:type I restriction enzyme, S subunit
MSEWKQIGLGETATFHNGYAFKPSDWSSEGKEIIRIQNLTKGAAQINYFEGELADKYKVEKGDILISWSGSLGVYEWDNEDAWLNQHLFKVVFDKEEMDKSFFKHLISTSLKKLESQVHGATMKHITKKKFDAFPVNLPPLPQQKKIAAILDAADAYRQKTKSLIGKYDELTQSLFLDMFGDPVTNPKGFVIKQLKDFGKIVTGNTPSRKSEDNYNSDHIEWIKTDNISSELLYVTKAKEYLSEEGLSNGRSVEAGSLLVACIAGSIKSIGRAALTNRKVAFNQQINAIEPSSNVNSHFLYHVFKSCPEYIQDHASNGMKRMLSKGDFQQIKMVYPPLELQNQFAERVQDIEAQKIQAQESLTKAEELFNSLLQKAFKGGFYE